MLNPQVRKNLSADGLFRIVRKSFEKLGKVVPPGGKCSLADALMSAFAMFSLKDPSLLQFDKRRSTDANLKTIFHIGHIPCDTRMREMLDPLDPDQLRPVFNRVLREAQRGKVLKKYTFFQGKLLLSLDGTGYFSSDKIHCQNCLKKVHRDGRVTYYHQLVTAVLIHPDLAEVISLAPEPICLHDGDTKNDCERNAVRRLIEKFRKEHPHLQVIVTEDGLSSNGPHIHDLNEWGLDWLLGVKEGDHQYLHQHIRKAFENDQVTVVRQEGDAPGRVQTICFAKDLPLNATHADLRVTWLSMAEADADGQNATRFDWVTNLEVTPENASELVRGGRARWKSENETHNTMKNQGYRLEHNFGHGHENLSVVLAMPGTRLRVTLAFLVDQLQQACCKLFQAVRQKCESNKRLWELQRSHFYHFTFGSMRSLHLAILNDLCKELPGPTLEAPLPATLDSS
jgi:hypothetical protein